MKRECVFKANVDGEWWYLYQYPNEKATRGCVYRVYYGRRWYDRISWFNYDMAMAQLLEGCLGLGSVNFGGIEQ